MKKLMAGLLTLLLVCSMSAAAWGADGVARIGEDVFVQSITGWNGGVNGVTVGGVQRDIDRDFHAGDSILLWLDPEQLLDAGGNPVYSRTSGLTGSNLSREKITVRRTVSRGAELVQSVSFGSRSFAVDAAGTQKKYSYVEVELVEEFVSVNDKALDMTVWLYLNNRKAQSLSLTGTMCVDLVEIAPGYDYLYLGDGQVAEATGYVRGIELDLGSGVRITANLFQNQRYFGVAKSGVSAEDGALLDAYPEIQRIITLHTVNLSGGGSRVRINVGELYHVYDAQGYYLGTTQDALPHSEKYYLSTQVIRTAASMAEASTQSSASVSGQSSAQPALSVSSSTSGEGASSVSTAVSTASTAESMAEATDHRTDNPHTGVGKQPGLVAAAGGVSLASVLALKRGR